MSVTAGLEATEISVRRDAVAVRASTQARGCAPENGGGGSAVAGEGLV